jgi:proteic killer suppression protein
MVESFADRTTKDLYHGVVSVPVKRFPKEILSAVLRKMDILNAAHDIDDLKAAPGNRLEALRGNMKRFHSIRVNIRWRIIFKWRAGGTYEVTMVDYH